MRLRGAANPNFSDAAIRVCTRCGVTYRSYNKNSKYCTHECYVNDQLETMPVGRWATRVDQNQAEIVEALRKVGIPVLVVSHIGGGLPDLITKGQTGLVFLEVKNPKSAYGRKGLAPSQQKWAKEWEADVVVVYSVQDALAAMGLKGGLT